MSSRLAPRTARAPSNDDPLVRSISAILTSGATPENLRDWTPLVRRAIDERVAPLLYWKLRADERLPGAERRVLRGELYRAEAQTLLLFRELERLLETPASEATSTPVILKGGALASDLYDEIGLRPMSDLDLLIPREELPLWLDRARRAGFRRLSPEMAPGLTEAVHYQVALVSEASDASVLEIHFGLVGGETDWRAPDPRWFLDRTEPWSPPRSFPSIVARQLDPTAHLLYLSAHAVLQHGSAQARMIWFHDLHLLLSRRGAAIRWSELAGKARELEWDGALGLALARVHELFASVLPEGFLQTLASGAARRGRAATERRADPSMSRAELVWSELRAQAPGRRFRWALAILFPQPGYMRWRYPRAGAFWPACYPYRLGRVLWEGAWALLARARSGSGTRAC